MRRAYALLLVPVLAVAGCTAGGSGAGDTDRAASGSRTAAPEAGARARQLSGVQVLPGGGDDLALAASKAVFEHSPAVVLASHDERSQATGATLAVAVGAPLLLTPAPTTGTTGTTAATPSPEPVDDGPVAAEVDRLGARTVVAVDDAAADFAGGLDDVDVVRRAARCRRGGEPCRCRCRRCRRAAAPRRAARPSSTASTCQRRSARPASCPGPGRIARRPGGGGDRACRRRRGAPAGHPRPARRPRAGQRAGGRAARPGSLALGERLRRPGAGAAGAGGRRDRRRAARRRSARAARQALRGAVRPPGLRRARRARRAGRRGQRRARRASSPPTTRRPAAAHRSSRRSRSSPPSPPRRSATATTPTSRPSST